MRTYSFYSAEKNAFVNVKAKSKKNVMVYAKEILHQQAKAIAILKCNNSHQESIEMAYKELF